MSVKVEIFARNMEVPDHLKDYVEKKASKLDHYLKDIDHVRVDLDYVKSARSANDRFVAQITVRGPRTLLRTEERADEITASFDTAIDKMQRQIERYKGKRERGRGDGRSAAEVVPVPDAGVVEETSIVVRRKTFEMIPMSEEEALEQMKLLGHDNFFVFHNIETDSINVLYRRRDGTYGLIEPRTG